VGVAISDLAAGFAGDGAGEAGNGCAMATQGFPALLAVAIKIAPDWPTKGTQHPAHDVHDVLALLDCW
jgi:hypothetical protein